MVQEFDEMLEGEPEIQTPIDAINWDYLRGYHGEVIRRREVDGETYTDMLQVVDHQGSVKQEASPDVSGTVGASNGYATHAEGEPLPIEQPSDIANHIQFHGGILEDSNIHTNPVTDGEMGYFYRMGVRHYSPGLHRFIQRDPLSYIRVPGRSTPLSLNPYIYGMNRPDQLSDVSGYQANPWGIMPMPCPGCFSPEGGGSGTDGGQGPIIINRPGPGNGNGTPPKDEEDAPICIVFIPDECITDERFDMDPPQCTKPCCRKDDQPDWRPSCCDPGLYVMNELCIRSYEGKCGCACCWAEGESQGENAPTILGGHFGGWNGVIAPRIGYGGNDGDPWSFRDGLFPARPVLPGSDTTMLGFASKSNIGLFDMPTPWDFLDPIGWAAFGVVGALDWKTLIVITLCIAGTLQGYQWQKDCEETKNPDLCKFFKCLCKACDVIFDWLPFIAAAGLIAFITAAVFAYPTGVIGWYTISSITTWILFSLAMIDAFRIFYLCMNK
jgi:RHS repeat-associated protein